MYPDELMIKAPQQQPEALLGWMTSLSDPTRLRLLRLLEGHELGVVDLCDILQLPQSTVSRHLKILNDQHFVRSTRRGTTHLYRMALDELHPGSQRLWLLAREQTENWATVGQDDLRLHGRLRARETSAQAFFAGAAAQWDKLRREMYGDAFTRSALLALIPSHYTVADLGCGTGQTVAELAGLVRRVIAVDSSAAMLNAARERIQGLGNVDLLRGDLAAIPVEDSTCDAALLILVLTYVADPAAVLREVRRILKPAGQLVIVDLLPHDRDDFRRQMNQTSAGIAAGDLRAWLASAGFSGITTRPLPPEPEAKGPALFLGTSHV
jgi:ubiquinone/menaquinone biosynthesis C-methylase UbiE